MTILKLPDVGNTATLTISDCDLVAGQYGTQVKFDGSNGDTLYMPAPSANRQLMRCGYAEAEQDEKGEPVPDYASVVGDTLTFSRTENTKKGAKPYWNIHVDTPRAAETKPASKRLPSPYATPAKAPVPALLRDDDTDPSQPPEPPELAPRPVASAPKPTAPRASAPLQPELDADGPTFADVERARQTALLCDTVRSVAANLKIPIDCPAVASLSATLFIQWARDRGLTP